MPRLTPVPGQRPTPGGIGLLLLAVLVSCQPRPPVADLQAWIERVESRPGVELEPLPEFVPYGRFVYSAAALRSPFVLAVATTGESGVSAPVEPDLLRPREPLESRELSTLRMVGRLQRQQRVEALIKDATGAIYRVGIGNYLGRNHGRIASIGATQLQLLEIVPDGAGGWVERTRTLALQQEITDRDGDDEHCQ